MYFLHVKKNLKITFSKKCLDSAAGRQACNTLAETLQR